MDRFSSRCLRIPTTLKQSSPFPYPTYHDENQGGPCYIESVLVIKIGEADPKVFTDE